MFTSTVIHMRCSFKPKKTVLNCVSSMNVFNKFVHSEKYLIILLQDLKHFCFVLLVPASFPGLARHFRSVSCSDESFLDPGDPEQSQNPAPPRATCYPGERGHSQRAPQHVQLPNINITCVVDCKQSVHMTIQHILVFN